MRPAERRQGRAGPVGRRHRREAVLGAQVLLAAEVAPPQLVGQRETQQRRHHELQVER